MRQESPSFIQSVRITGASPPCVRMRKLAAYGGSVDGLRCGIYWTLVQLYVGSGACVACDRSEERQDGLAVERLPQERRRGATDRHEQIRFGTIDEGGSNVVDDGWFRRADKPGRANHHWTTFTGCSARWSNSTRQTDPRRSGVPTIRRDRRSVVSCELLVADAGVRRIRASIDRHGLWLIDSPD